MPEIKDPREVEGFEIIVEKNGIFKILIKEQYSYYFYYNLNITDNCQLASAMSFCNLMFMLNKYKIRDLFIKIRNSNFYTKRLLLLDLQKQHALKVIEWLAPSSIICNAPYISSNGSEMNIIIIKLSLIRQLQLPK